MTKLPTQCEFEDCTNWKEGNLPYCSTHNAHFRREARKDKQPKPSVRPLQKGYIRKVSEKRQEQNQEYAAMRDQFLIEHPVCMNCGDPSTEIHHARGRTNELLLDRQYFRALCHGCHEMVTLDTDWAVKMGISVYRNRQQEQ